MFRKKTEFQVLPVGTIVVKDGHYYRVHDYGLTEIPAPVMLAQPQDTQEG